MKHCCFSLRNQFPLLLELSRYVVRLRDWDWSQAGVTFLLPSSLAQGYTHDKPWDDEKKMVSFFLRLMAKFCAWGSSLSCPGHEADQIKGSKLQELFCHHKNPENEANKVLRVVKKPSLFNLIWTPGPSCAWSQDFSITRIKTSLFWIKYFWVRYSITCYWKGPHWYKVK